MAPSTVHQQLADLLGHTVSAIRIIRQCPACVSVLDVVLCLSEDI